jgi:hypothetical protein
MHVSDLAAAVLPVRDCGSPDMGPAGGTRLVGQRVEGRVGPDDETATRARFAGTVSGAGAVYLVDRSLRAQAIVAGASETETADAPTMGVLDVWRTELAVFEDDAPFPGPDDAPVLECDGHGRAFRPAAPPLPSRSRVPRRGRRPPPW